MTNKQDDSKQQPTLWRLRHPKLYRLWWEAELTFGHALNMFFVPGFVRDGSYSGVGVTARVKVGRLSTAVDLNGLEVRFCRFTGRITSVGRRASIPIAEDDQTHASDPSRDQE